MKIGLVRHFKVQKGLPEKMLMTPDELIQWFKEYDASDVEFQVTDLGGVEWHACFTSDMDRAVKTAKTIYNKEITSMKELREIPHPDFKQIMNRRLPFLFWALLVKLAWKFEHKSCVENKQDVQKRISKVLNLVLSQGKENVLIVSHAGLMMEMEKELIHRGLRGPKLGTPQNGKLYLFEK